MIPYINLHTHHLSKDNGVFLFNNRFGFDKEFYINSFFTIGIHPWDADLHVSMPELEKIILHPKCLAIGECGLDKLKGPDIDIQKQIFVSQLELAVTYQKPVIIHCVKAFDEMIELCKPYYSKISLIIHGFNKSQQLLFQLLDKGFYVSLHASFFNRTDVDFLKMPKEKIFLETDDDERVSIDVIYKKAAVCFHQSNDDLKEKIYTNFTTLFKL